MLNCALPQLQGSSTGFDRPEMSRGAETHLAGEDCGLLDRSKGQPHSFGFMQEDMGFLVHVDGDCAQLGPSCEYVAARAQISIS